MSSFGNKDQDLLARARKRAGAIFLVFFCSENLGSAASGTPDHEGACASPLQPARGTITGYA